MTCHRRSLMRSARAHDGWHRARRAPRQHHRERRDAEDEPAVEPDDADERAEHHAGVSKDDRDDHDDRRQRQHLEKELGVEHDERVGGRNSPFGKDEKTRRLGAGTGRRERGAKIAGEAGAHRRAE